MTSCNYDLEVKPPETWGTKVGLGEISISRSGTINAFVSRNAIGQQITWANSRHPEQAT